MVYCLDENGEKIENSYASAFIVREEDGLYLYTCWHVVTGLDMHQLPMKAEKPKRRGLRVSMQNAVEQQTGSKLRAFVIDGLRTQDIPLYESRNDRDSPLWNQDPTHNLTDLNVVKIAVPDKHDAVKLRLPESFQTSDMHLIEQSALHKGLIFPGDRIYIVGFPYNYSTRGPYQPVPVVLTRFIAGTQVEGRLGEFLLDGSGAPGMSGGPAFVERDGQIHLVGLYKGIIYTAGVENKDKDVGALGACVDMSLCWTHKIAALCPLQC